MNTGMKGRKILKNYITLKLWQKHFHMDIYICYLHLKEGTCSLNWPTQINAVTYRKLAEDLRMKVTGIMFKSLTITC